MSVYRFLRAGAVDPLTGGTWRPAQWMAPPGGFVACQVADLPHWAADELWTVELDGEVTERQHSVAATRGRIVERVDAWDGTAAAAFIEACRTRRPELDTDPGGNPCTAAYIAAHAAGVVAEESGAGYQDAYEAERAWQSEWLTDRLGLVAVQE